jgi:hypothetical protein
MSERRPIGWIVGLIALAAVTFTAAVVLTWVSSDLQIQVNRYWESTNGSEPVAEDVYREWDRISMNAYLMLTLVTPLLMGGIVAIMGLLAVLAFRWERRRQLVAATSADATAAS